MNGILVLAHGSKRDETERTLDSLVGKVKEKSSIRNVEACCLQFSSRDLETGIQTLVNQGVRNIKVIPMFIFDGIHVTQDIPEELEKIKEKFNEIEISLGKHIGDDDRLADIIVDRIYL